MIESVAIMDYEEMLEYMDKVLVNDRYRLHVPEEIEGKWLLVLTRKEDK